jgi:FkbM family methyltransferase
MSDHLGPVKSVVRWGLNLMPISFLEKIEDVVQRQLGKGSGAWSTRNEAKALSHFIEIKSLRNVFAIDAGANLGNWSQEILELYPSAVIAAFEPSKEAYRKLSNRFLNHRSIYCENLALGKRCEKVKLFSDQSGSGLGSFTKRRVEHFDINFDHEEEVEVITLDSWIDNLKIDFIPNILKMDVEGHELDILTGAKDTLGHIEIIQFEFGGSNIDSRTYFQDFWYFFTERNYELYRITPKSPILIKNYTEKYECFQATNYLAVKR